MTDTQQFEEVLRALRMRLAGSPKLRYQPAEDIAHDLKVNGYLDTESGPEVIGAALERLQEEGLLGKAQEYSKNVEPKGPYHPGGEK